MLQFFVGAILKGVLIKNACLSRPNGFFGLLLKYARAERYAEYVALPSFKLISELLFL